MKVGIDQQGRLARTRQTTKSTTYARYIGLYLKHETTNVMDLFTNLFRIIALVRLSLVLLPPPFRNGHQTMFGSISTRQACNEDFVRSGHHFTSLRLQSTWRMDSGMYRNCAQQTVAPSNNRTGPIGAASDRPWPNRRRPRSIFQLSERSASKCWLFLNKT